MKIGIVGAGNIGGSLTRRLSTLGHDVCVANSRGPETLAALAEETGARAVSLADAPRGAELLIVTIPEKSVPSLPDDLCAQATRGAVVIDTGNYYPRQRDGLIKEIEDGMPESRWVEQQLGHPVIKAFNTIYAERLLKGAKATGAPGRVALPVAGDDPDAKELVLRLVEQLGFDAVDAGGLGESWRQQPGTPVYGADLDSNGVRRALVDASRERPPEFRAG